MRDPKREYIMVGTTKLLDCSSRYSFAAGAYHIAYFIHGDDVPEPDPISGHLESFMDGHEPQATQWIRLATYLTHKAFPFDAILQADASHDIVRTTAAQLTRVCDALERKSGAKKFANVRQILAANLPPATKVLVVDTILRESSIVKILDDRLKEAFPQGETRYFALGMIDAEGKNDHLDAAYFTSHQPPGPVVAETKVHVTPTVPSPAPVPRVVLRQSSRFGWMKSVGALFGLAAVLLFSAFVLINRRQPLPAPTLSYEVPQPSSSTTPAPRVEPPAPIAVPVPREPVLPQAVVTVPSVGLRQNHSIDSPRMKVRLLNGERVAIVKRFQSSAGPNWVQVRNKSGSVGWLLASLLREVRSR